MISQWHPYTKRYESGTSVVRFHCPDAVWKATMSAEGLDFRILSREDDEKDYDGKDDEKADEEDDEKADEKRPVLYEKTIEKKHIRGVKGQRHGASKYGEAYNLLRIILTVDDEAGDDAELVPQTKPEDERDLVFDCGRITNENKWVDGFGYFDPHQRIPTGKRTDLCIFQEIVLVVGGEPWRKSSVVDNCVFGGYQDLLRGLQYYTGVPSQYIEPGNQYYW